MTAEPQDAQAPERAPRHLERRRYKRKRGEQLDYVREAVPHVDDAETAAPATVGPPPGTVTPSPPAPPAPARPTIGDSSFTGARRGPVYNPGGLSSAEYASSSRRSGSSQSVVTSRRRRSGAGKLVTLGVLAALGLGGWQAYPTAHAKAVDWAHERVSGNLQTVATQEAQYRQLYGQYTLDLSALTLDSTVDDVRVVRADASALCLQGSPILGPDVYFTPATGQTTTPCS